MLATLYIARLNSSLLAVYCGNDYEFNLTIAILLCSWGRHLTAIFLAWLQVCGGNAVCQQ